MVQLQQCLHLLLCPEKQHYGPRKATFVFSVYSSPMLFITPPSHHSKNGHQESTAPPAETRLPCQISEKFFLEPWLYINMLPYLKSVNLKTDFKFLVPCYLWFTEVKSKLHLMTQCVSVVCSNSVGQK